jgi:SAM-dependent methyltransferase
MLKLYRPEGSVYTAQDVESWNRTWDEHSIEAAIRWAAACHLTPVFDRYFPRTGKILEGGCGLGQFVVHYRRRGYDIEGVDFSPLAIERLKSLDPALPVALADVRKLPYPDASVACYYSGGVVEHFEEGPTEALAEARRVLAPDGVLLITVPYVNWIRRGQSLAGKKRRWWDVDTVQLERRARMAVEPSPAANMRFAEYVFGRGEFRRILEAHGFRVERALGCDVEWGEVVQVLYRWLRRERASSPHAGPAAGASPSAEAQGTRARAVKLWKELFVLEHPRMAALRPLVHALGAISGHMALFVARPAGGRLR